MGTSIPFETKDWSKLPAVEYPGETGVASWRTVQHGGLRIRLVEYSANYKADHWCERGHILYCVSGELVTELDSGIRITLKPNMSYHVSDGMGRHRSITSEGATLFVVDGDFLAP